MKVLVTGSAGFIGYHLASRLLRDGHSVIGLDAFVPYYDVRLKERRHELLGESPAFTPCRQDLADRPALDALLAREAPEVVIHLAAQAGVRYALEHPETYIDSNVIGTFNLLEACRQHPVRHLLMASTSSVYGANTKLPFAEADPATHPLTVYSATKQATELMAHCYAHLWAQPITAFRFFTVYGPWGRPDMALFKFTDAILKDRPIEIYNHGEMMRDFTYVDDLVEAIIRLVAVVPVRGEAVEGDSLSPVAPFRVVNIGNNAPVRLLDFVAEIERCLGRPARRHYTDMHPGDVPATWADTTLLQRLTGFQPGGTPLAEGVARFVAWYRDYYRA
jgi:UDP-glucuronate 4-epimerase